MSFHDKLPNPIQKIGEQQIVKTPIPLVNRILDSFPIEVWSNKNKRWLVPVSKTGIFELGIYVRLMNGLAASVPNSEERRAWIVREMIWSFTPTRACELMVRRNYLGKVWNSMRDTDALEGNVQTRDFLKSEIVGKGGLVMQNKNGKSKYVEFHNIVGNPPYQDSGQNGRSDPKNLYPGFVLKAIGLKPDYLSMVIPARWMGGAGKGIAPFLKTMIECKKISKIVSTEDSKKWFPDVDIKGGTMFFLYDNAKSDTTVNINGVEIDLLGQECIITDVLGLDIAKKILDKSTSTFDKVMLRQKAYGIETNHSIWSSDPNKSYICHCSGGAGSGDVSYFIDQKLINKNVNTIPKWKLCCGSSSGKGKDGTGKTFVIEPNHIVSNSYNVMGMFDSEENAKNAENYLLLKLPQFLVSLLKITHHQTAVVFKYVPYLDFSKSYTDQDLYTMFDLSNDEIAHVENTTKNFPMFKVKAPKPQGC